MTTDTGGPAFPCEGGNKFISGNEIRKTLPSSGMDLRDYFAAKAMQGLISTAGSPCLLGMNGCENETARAAYKLADAMLLARSGSYGR